MTQAQLEAIEAMLRRRTAENTATAEDARRWILRDGVHRADGWLAREPADRPAAENARQG